jgi:hypothetical protein
MSNTTRGRPTKHTNVLVINDLVVEYLTTKKDNYNNEISYFKIVDSSFRNKLKPLFSLNDDGSLKMPIWVTDKSEHILKVKSTFIVNHKDLVERTLHVININFEYYHMEQANVKGYYGKISKVMAMAQPQQVIEVEISDDN